MNRQENTRNLVIVFCLLSVAVIWLALLVAGSYEDGMKLLTLLQEVASALNQPWYIHFNEYSLKFVLVFLVAYALGVGAYFSQRENRRPGEEHGSAKWGNAQSVARKYADRKHKFKNIILSQTLALSLNAKSHRRNLNVLVVGGSGAGKTRFYAKPNILQANTSFIVADPKGELLRAIASNEADKRIRKAVFADETNGYGYAILSVIANNTIRTMRDMYLRPEAYERYEAYLRELLADILTDVSNGRDFDDAWDAAHTRMYQAINPSYTPRGFAMDFCYMDTPAIDMAMYNRAHKLLSEYRPQ